MTSTNTLLQRSCFILALLLTSSYSFADDKINKSEKNPNPEDPSNILIQEGGLSVTRGEVQLMIQDMSFKQQRKIANKPEYLKSLIFDKLVLKKQEQEAIKLGIDKNALTQWKINNARQNILSRDLMAQQKNKITPPKDIILLAEQTYKTNPDRFIVKEKIKVAHILLKANAKDPELLKNQRDRLEEIKKEILAGLDFAEAAKKYSDDKSNAGSGGILNFFAKGRMVAAFDKAAFALEKPGDMSDLIKTRFGFHLIKMLERKEKTIKPFEAVKAQLISAEKSKYIQTELEEYSNKFTVSNKATLYIPALEKMQTELRDNIEKTLKDIGFKK
jgi:peptidyl-prolyl cis-trans isomerase C